VALNIIPSKAKWVIFQLYHGENMLHFDEIMMMSALYHNNTLSWMFIVLAHWNNISDKGNNKITELRTILQRESQNS
jgi:hypothetical protein